MNIIINPGTEKQTNTTEKNAVRLAEYILEDLGGGRFERLPERDNDKGWYGFIFKGYGGEIDVDIPGIDPNVVRESEPFKSPRLYVNGSSWLYGYALDFIREGIKKESI